MILNEYERQKKEEEIDNIFIDYLARGGSHPNPERDIFERQIVKQAFNIFLQNPKLAKKGLKWIYNYLYFRHIYAQRNPELVKFLFKNRPYPEYIEIETTTCCNLKCNMCEHTYWKEEPKNMTFEQFKYILDQFPRLSYIGLTGIGASYLNPDYEKMVRYVKKKFPSCFLEEFDVFLDLNDERCKEMVNVGVDKIYVSMDAATKETYEKIRVGSNFEKVLENIKRLDKWKKKLNSSTPEIWFHYIISKDNINEIEKYLDLIHQLDIDVGTIQFTRLLHDYPEIKNKFIEIPDSMKDKIIKKGQELGLAVSWNMNSAENKDPMNLCSIWTMPFIFVDGTVIPCCSLNEQNDREWQRKTSLGNIFKQNMREIWYGEKYTQMLKELESNKCPPNCSRCVLYKIQ